MPIEIPSIYTELYFFYRLERKWSDEWWNATPTLNWSTYSTSLHNVNGTSQESSGVDKQTNAIVKYGAFLRSTWQEYVQTAVSTQLSSVRGRIENYLHLVFYSCFGYDTWVKKKNSFVSWHYYSGTSVSTLPHILPHDCSLVSADVYTQTYSVANNS